jgi:ubiquitin-protein ligase
MTQAIPKRLQKEIEHARGIDMESQGIFYHFNEMNIMMGKAMIIGPQGTPYEGCLLCFSIQYPHDYPFSSPAVRIITSDGLTRFHPNLYIDGKVCLSILGTWKGPKWAPVMTVSTVLNTIQSILEANPIVNEPGYETLRLTDSDAKAKDYADFVQYRLISHTFRGLHAWKKGALPTAWVGFEDVLEEHGDKFINTLTQIIEEKAGEEKIYRNIFYNMGGATEWKSLLEVSKHMKG